MYDRTGNYLIVAILIGMILGVVTVALFGTAMLPFKFLGDIFLNALKMVVIPLLFCSMIVGIANLGDIRKLGRTGVKTLLYFVATSSIAVVIGLVLVNVIQPGAGFDVLQATVPDDVVGGKEYSFFAWLTDQIPSNIVHAAAETQVLPIIVFALFFGGVLTTIGAKGKPVLAFFEGVNEAIMKIVHIIMWYAPIGIFGLVAGQLAAEGGLGNFTGVLTALGKYSLVVLLGLLIHGLIVLPMFLKFIGGKNPIEYFVGMGQALVTAFATASSSATLPVSMRCVEEKNDVDKRASSFVLPLGATINMDGTALYEAVAAMFIAQAYGIALPIWSQITIFATAVLASVGAAGIPQAGLVTMVLVLQAVGLPLEGIGLILAIDWFLDRCRTTVNVWGDSIGAAVIATTAEIGLVDRKKIRRAKKERSLRARSKPSPKKESRFKRKRKDRASGPTVEKIPAQPAPKEPPRKNNRPPQKAEPHGDKTDGSRSPQSSKPSRPSQPNGQKRQEEFSGKKGPSRPSGKPDKGGHGKGRDDSGRPSKKATFGGGRRQSAPDKPQPRKEKEEPKKDHPVSSGKSANNRPVADKEARSEFDVPKFPDSILDELVSETSEPEQEKNGKKQDKEPERAISKDGSEDAARHRGKRDRATSKKANESGEIEVGQDFSRLDEAVLGPTQITDTRAQRGIETEDTGSSGETKEDSISVPDAENPASEIDTGWVKEETETASDEDKSSEEPEKPSEDEKSKGDSGPAMEFGRSKSRKGKDIKSAGEKSPETGDSESLISGDENGDSEERREDAETEVSRAYEPESADSDEQDEMDDDMKWGRHKHKKYGR